MSFVITAKPERQYEIPNEGAILAVLSEVQDLGEVETDFGPRHRVRLWWLVDQIGKDGERIEVMQTFNVSMHEKSSLRKTLRSVIGRDPGDEIDLETLVGTNCQLVIEHHEGKDGRVFANVSAILKPPKGSKEMGIDPEWVSHSERKRKATAPQPSKKPAASAMSPPKSDLPPKASLDANGVDASDEDIPF